MELGAWSYVVVVVVTVVVLGMGIGIVRSAQRGRDDLLARLGSQTS